MQSMTNQARVLKRVSLVRFGFGSCRLWSIQNGSGQTGLSQQNELNFVTCLALGWASPPFSFLYSFFFF